MPFLSYPITFAANWLSRRRFPYQRPRRKNQIHTLGQSDWGDDCVFEPIDGGSGGYMTGLRKGIERGDYLILADGSNSTRYQVLEIDYYSNSPDIWIALLGASAE